MKILIIILAVTLVIMFLAIFWLSIWIKINRGRMVHLYPGKQTIGLKPEKTKLKQGESKLPLTQMRQMILR